MIFYLVKRYLLLLLLPNLLAGIVMVIYPTVFDELHVLELTGGAAFGTAISPSVGRPEQEFLFDILCHQSARFPISSKTEVEYPDFMALIFTQTKLTQIRFFKNLPKFET